MSGIRSIKRSTEEFLIGKRLNRYDIKSEGRSRKANRVSLQAASASYQARTYPEDQGGSFATKLQAAINADRGGISLAQAIAEGQF